MVKEILCDQGTFHLFFLQIICEISYCGPVCFLDTRDTPDNQDRQKSLMKLKCEQEGQKINEID